MKHVACLCATALAACLVISCGPPPENLAIHASLSEGAFVQDDVYFTNKSGRDLHDVQVVLTIVGEKQDAKTQKRFWSSWAAEEEKHISMSIFGGETVHNIQLFKLEGRCREGIIGWEWRPKG